MTYNPTYARAYRKLHRERINAYQNHWRKTNLSPEKKALYAKRRTTIITNLINSAKQRPCTDCNQSYPTYIMDFDHLTQKSFTISKRRSAVSIARLLAEIAKCEVVCSNCHRERTFGPPMQ